MTELDVIAYLASKGLQGRKATGDEYAFPCFASCGESPTSRKRKLYVNAAEGLWDCKCCGQSGGTYLLQKLFGDDPNGMKPAEGEDPHTKRRILNWAADVGVAMLHNNDDVMLYLLNERGLSPETIEENKIGYVGQGWSLTGSLPEQFTKKELAGTGLVYRDGPRVGNDFFYNHLLVPYQVRGNVVQIRGRAWEGGKGGKYLTGPSEPVRIFGTDDLEGAEECVIVEGEFDRMVLKQHLQSSPSDRVRKIAVIGLAGANGFKEADLILLTDIRRVFIALDPDDTGRREAVKIKELCGTKARIVELPAELPKCDWSEYLLAVPAGADADWHARHAHAGHTWQDAMALLGNAAGKRVFTMSEAGHTWRAQKSLGDGVKTGFDPLDTVIGGVLPGQVMVVLAKTGTGKTIWLCNLAYQMRSHRVLFLSLEMTREEVYERLRRIYLFWNPLASDVETEAALANVLICDENRLGEKDLQVLLDEYEIETGARPEVCLVDYLGYYARGARGNNNYEKVTNAVMQLKAEAKAGRVIIVTPAQVNRIAKEGKPIDLDDARDSGAIEETADFLLALWRPDEALTPDGNVGYSGVVKMTLLKSRHGGKGRTFELLMDRLTLAMVTKDDTGGYARAYAHNNFFAQGWNYEQLRTHDLRPRQQALMPA